MTRTTKARVRARGRFTRRTTNLELDHLILESLAFFPNDVVDRDADVLKPHLQTKAVPCPQVSSRNLQARRWRKLRTCVVSEDLMPSLEKRGATVTPGATMGTHIMDLFSWIPPSPVFASRHIQSAWVPFVVHILPPLITYSSPSRTAVVLIAATSEPAPTSLTWPRWPSSVCIVGAAST